MDNVLALPRIMLICTEICYAYNATGGSCQELRRMVGMPQGDCYEVLRALRAVLLDNGRSRSCVDPETLANLVPWREHQ